ncbi:MAG: DUF3857 domain-containing protein, partial [Cyclobacteriaceae bacterium]
VHNIPDSLTKGASSIYRYNDVEFEMESTSKGVFRRKFALTILNAKARNAAEITLPDSKLHPLSGISANVYDANGVLVRKLKRTEISDYSDFDGYSVYSDSRIKSFDLRRSSYPYTIEVAYETKYNGLMTMPTWIAQAPNKRSIQSSTFTVTTPSSYDLRMKISNLDDPKITNEGGTKKYEWKVSNLTPSQSEVNSADTDAGYKIVYLAPSQFEMEGYPGDFSSWESFGNWYNRLNQGRNELSEKDMSEINQLVSNVSDKREKIKLVYEYLQKNTRYVSIQLGIGGWQTFPASYVAENGYGDCKALTNYTSSVLKNIGINSYYTLVSAGQTEDDIDVDFPSNQFNHVILCVPLERDTVWLECTSQTDAFGYLGYYTSDRHVLVINENGGTIAHTPVYKAEENQYLTTGDFTIDKDGNGNVSMESKFSGLSFNYVENFNMLNNTETMELVRRMFPVNNLEVDDIQFSEEKKEIPIASLKVDFSARKVAKVSGKRIFLIPNQINRTEYIPSKIDNRTTDFEVKYEQNVIDSITFYLPEGIHAEHIPESRKIETKFGVYEVSYEKGDGYLKYNRRYVTRKGKYDKNLYNDFVKFKEDCAKADKQKVVFLKST